MKRIRKGAEVTIEDLQQWASLGDRRTLSERIKRYVLDKIDDGSWPEDTRLPSESELAQAFGVANVTMHAALRDLARDGLLVRRPGAGTRIAQRRPQSTFLEVRNIQDEITERGHRHTAEVRRLREEACELVVASELEVPPGSPVFNSLIIHFENGRPLHGANRFLSASFAPDYLSQDFNVTTPNRHLMSLGPLDEVEHVIQALMPDRTIRSLLKLPAAEPVLHVRRRTWSGGAVVSSARLIHPGHSYSVVGRFKMGLVGSRRTITPSDAKA